MKRLATASDAITHLHNGENMTIEELTTLEKLNEAFRQCSRISHWKESTQRYKVNLLPNNIELQKELRNGTYKISKTTGFELRERGKLRHIEAPAIRDRIVQKVLCQYILVPQLTRPLIYDNYASLKNRGTSFARKRIVALIQKYIRKHGTEGYILQIDIKQYFGSIDHDILKELVHKRIHETPEIMNLIDHVIDASVDKGLNLGSEAPQIFAIYYLSPVDTYVKTVRGVKYYGRYMDDIFVISDSKEELKSILEDIKAQLRHLKLEINEKKTHITTLKHGFTFMQIKYNVIAETGKIIKRPTHSKIVRERRRLKKYKILYDKGVVNELHIRNAYKSWRNGVTKDCNACKRTIKSMDRLYIELFPNKETRRKYNREYIIKTIFRKEKLWILENAL